MYHKKTVIRRKQILNVITVNFVSKKKTNLNKHTNKQNIVKAVYQRFFSECFLFEDKFETKSELEKHKDEHIEEIEEYISQPSLMAMKYLSVTCAASSLDTRIASDNI